MFKNQKILAFIICFITVFCCITVCGCGGRDGKRSSYDITCEYDNGTLTGKEEVCFYNNTDNVFSTLKFNIFANAFRKDATYSPISAQYYSRATVGKNKYGNMEILSVTHKEKELEFLIEGKDQNVLTVQLNKEVFPEESIKICISFKVNLADVIARTGINDKTVNLANFYPILCGISDGAFYECLYYANGDPFFSDVSNYKVTITLDSSFVVAGSGEVVKKIAKDNKCTYVYKLDNARSFNFVLSEKFKVLSVKNDGVEINYYYYKDENANDNLNCAIKSLEYFSNTFGKYPYSTFSVVQTEFLQGGMEFPTLVMISDELEDSAYSEVIVHETAHQWWQSVVGNNEIEYGFLDEGLAEYSVVLFYENYKEYGYTRKNLIKSSEETYKTFCSVYDKLFNKVDTSMLRPLGEYSSEYEYVNIAYVKPCIMYDYLRTTVGDNKFFSALRRYYSNYAFKNATPNDLVGAFEGVGADSNGFFQTFFNGKEII